MMYRGRVDRAIRWQKQNMPGKDGSSGEKPYEPEIADELEKGDMFALILSGTLTILPACVLALSVIVFAAMLFFRIF